MMPGKKGGLDVAMLVAKKVGKKPPAGPDGDEADGEESDVGMESAAEDMMAAMKSGDASAFASAFKSAVTMCKG